MLAHAGRLKHGLLQLGAHLGLVELLALSAEPVNAGLDGLRQPLPGAERELHRVQCAVPKRDREAEVPQGVKTAGLDLRGLKGGDYPLGSRSNHGGTVPSATFISSSSSSSSKSKPPSPSILRNDSCVIGFLSCSRNISAVPHGN